MQNPSGPINRGSSRDTSVAPTSPRGHQRRGSSRRASVVRILLEPRRGSLVKARRKCLLIVLLATAPGACTVVPAPIVAPPGYLASKAPAFTWSVGVAGARARIVDGQGQTRDIAGNGAAAWGDSDSGALPLHLLLPSMLSWHVAEAPLDGGAYVGLRRLGVVGRVQVHAFASGASTSVTAAGNVHWSGAGYDASLGLEQIVPFPSTDTAGLLRLGAGAGRRNFDIQVPQDLSSCVEGPVCSSYLVVARGAPRDVHCASCSSNVQLVDFQQSFGVAFALTVVAR
jgi:hypothetical protein